MGIAFFLHKPVVTLDQFWQLHDAVQRNQDLIIKSIRYYSIGYAALKSLAALPHCVSHIFRSSKVNDLIFGILRATDVAHQPKVVSSARKLLTLAICSYMHVYRCQ